jgi:type IV secretory pathway component VirB8
LEILQRRESDFGGNLSKKGLEILVYFKKTGNLKSDIQKLRSSLKKLKILLIILTIIELANTVLMFTHDVLWFKFYNLQWVIFGIHYIIAVIFIWFIWKKMPLEKKSKSNNTFLIFFFGIIGMWLWMPNKKEVDKLIQKQSIVNL